MWVWVARREHMLAPPQLDTWSLRRFAAVFLLMDIANSDWICQVYKTVKNNCPQLFFG